MIDLEHAKYVEITRDETGKLWINVNSICMLRIGYVENLALDCHYRDTSKITVDDSTLILEEGR